VREAFRVEQMQLVKQRRDGRQAAIDGGIGPALTVLLLNEGQAMGSADLLRQHLDDAKEQFEVEGVVQPGVMGTTELEEAEKVGNLG
jgi:hypothetical protein